MLLVFMRIENRVKAFWSFFDNISRCNVVPTIVAWSFADCPTDAFLPRVQHGTQEVFTQVGTELWSLVNTDLEDTYLDLVGDVCGTSLSAEAIQRTPLNYSRQVALFHKLSHLGVILTRSLRGIRFFMLSMYS